MIIIWQDPAVQSALISSLGSVLAAAIAGICAAVIGKQFSDRAKMKEKLVTAIDDIAFLLAVEEAHCDLHTNNGDKSRKLAIRTVARGKGLSWSGKYTPGRVEYLKTNGGYPFSMIEMGSKFPRLD